MKRKTAKTLMAISGIILGMVVALAGGAYAILHIQILSKLNYAPDTHETRTIETNLENIDAKENIKEGFKIPVLETPKIVNYLLIGSDRRDPSESGRSDAMMILTLNENTKKIHITSLSRAIYVSIPDEPSPGMEPYLMTEYMLNAAHSWGGARLLMRTIERNFRIQLDGYFEVGFDGFSQVIDTIGGIDLELTAAEADYLNTHVPGYGFYEGYNRLYGEAALHYARIRKIDSDFARMDRQRYVIETLLREALNSGTGQMLDVMQAVLPLVTTDVSGGEITGLIMKAPQYINYEIDQLRIPIDGTGEVVYINSMEMWDIDWVTNINRLHEFMSE